MKSRVLVARWQVATEERGTEMSSKTLSLARSGVSLFNRLLQANGNHHHSIPIVLPNLSCYKPSASYLLNCPTQASSPQTYTHFGEALGDDADVVRRLSSPEGAFFPCGLPSLRFFIGEGEFFKFEKKYIFLMISLTLFHVILVSNPIMSRNQERT